MKPLIIISIVFAITLSGCGKDYHNTFTVVNNTNKQVRIEGFAVKWSEKINRFSVYSDSILIDANSEFSIQKGMGESRQPQGIFQSGEIDSVNIIFDNQKIIKYSCDDEYHLCFDKRNLLNYEEYFEKNCDEHECTYVYTITDADYESAEIIE